MFKGCTTARPVRVFHSDSAMNTTAIGVVVPAGCQGARSVEPYAVLCIWLPAASSWHQGVPPLERRRKASYDKLYSVILLLSTTQQSSVNIHNLM